MKNEKFLQETSTTQMLNSNLFFTTCILYQLNLPTQPFRCISADS